MGQFYGVNPEFRCLGLSPNTIPLNPLEPKHGKHRVLLPGQNAVSQEGRQIGVDPEVGQCLRTPVRWGMTAGTT